MRVKPERRGLGGDVVGLPKQIQDLHTIEAEYSLLIQDRLKAVHIAGMKDGVGQDLPAGIACPSIRGSNSFEPLNGTSPHARGANLIVGLTIAVQGDVEVEAVRGNLSDALRSALGDQRAVGRDRHVESAIDCIGQDLLDVGPHERLAAEWIEDLHSPVRRLVDDTFDFLETELRRVVACGAHGTGQIAAQCHI